MHTFLFLALPCALIWYTLTNSKYEPKAFIAPLLTGALLAIVSCAFQEFFTFSFQIRTESHIRTFISMLLKDTTLPVLVITAIFAFFCNDDNEYKSSAVFPLSGAFYAVFLPYHVMTGESKAAFLLIAKPVLISAMLFAFTAFLQASFYALDNAKKPLSITMAVTAVLVTTIPSVFETAWYYGVSDIILSIAALVILAATIAFYVAVHKTHERKPIFMSM